MLTAVYLTYYFAVNVHRSNNKPRPPPIENRIYCSKLLLQCQSMKISSYEFYLLSYEYFLHAV